MSKDADHEDHPMDEAMYATQQALPQRFDALKAQLDQIHTRWRQAVVAKDFARQHTLIAQERALSAQVHTVVEAFKASWACLQAEEEDRSMPGA